MTAPLKLIESTDTAEPVTGDQLVADIAALLTDQLPLVPQDDPYWTTLQVMYQSLRPWR